MTAESLVLSFLGSRFGAASLELFLQYYCSFLEEHETAYFQILEFSTIPLHCVPNFGSTVPDPFKLPNSLYNSLSNPLIIKSPETPQNQDIDADRPTHKGSSENISVTLKIFGSVVAEKKPWPLH